MRQPTQGIHHITALASNPQWNVDFYTQVLGQRLVKTTVNFDDPGTYHLYYGDQVGSPGTIMTFFPWPHARRGVTGNGEVAVTAYAIAPESVAYWQERLAEHGVPLSEPETRFGQTVIPLADPDGTRLELIIQPDVEVPSHWEDGPVPAEHALRGFHGVTIWVSQSEQTAELLTQTLGYQFVGQEGLRQRYRSAGQGVGQFVDLLVRLNQPRGRMGAGSVHHVAFRTGDDDEQREWQHEVAKSGYGVTEVRDRQYFHSIYFREPSGVLFEIATDPPGFTLDEPVAELGQGLKLPPWLEPQRAMITQKLPSIQIPPLSGAQVTEQADA